MEVNVIQTHQSVEFSSLYVDIKLERLQSACDWTQTNVKSFLAKSCK